ncbi:RidA family protein [Marinobacter orientalis]|uniref:RidA family protein n=1 Tax=Marinobacter orientalis TaxID=1928859 RepID=A0A7Y0NK96_9GAMM|nr:RidA family protein [Marinobacter orientalis]NMT62724.1 RidA family protein [Marinobacter orientalis]TGX51407.1 RidA family protein [Marinobacter orientalis]
MQILNPPHWKRPKGYSNGIAAQGQLVVTGGIVGWDETETFKSSDFIDQLRQTLQNILTILQEADAGPEHIVRLTWYVVDKQEYLSRLNEVGRVYRDVIGRHFPAIAMVQVAGLVEEEAKMEIEATAVVPD